MKGVFNASVFMGRPLYPADITTTVSVYNAETDVLVPTLWLDRDGVNELANPHPLAEDGVILFYVDPGRYNIVVEKGPMLYREWPDVIISDSATSGTPGIQSIIPGTNVTVDDTDPANPVVSAIAYLVVTEQLTGSLTLDADDIGKHFYTLAATSANITVTVPAALGDGFHCSFFHEGTGTFTVAGDTGVVVEVPVDGALTLPTGGYGSICVFGSDALIKLFGQTDTAP